MAGIIGPFKTASTTQNLIECYLAGLRQLTVPEVAKGLLTNVHRYHGDDLDDRAALIAGHIGQALEFRRAASSAAPTIRPVLQYYCYLNLISTAALCYGNFGVITKIRRHGISDRTSDLPRIDLDSVLVYVDQGVFTQFHSIISTTKIEDHAYTLRALLSAIPLVQHELLNDFSIEQHVISFVPLVSEQSGDATRLVSSLQFRMNPAVVKKLPAGHLALRIEEILGDVRFDYTRVDSKADEAFVRYDSRQTWPKSERDTAFEFHQKACRRAVNWGGHEADPSIGIPRYAWRSVVDMPMIPTLSAGVMLSFAMASVARYRPWLLRELERSKYYLLWDTFLNEADGFMIPSIRNLVFAEELVLSKLDFQ